MKCEKHGIENCPICKVEPLKRSDIAADRAGFKLTEKFCNRLRKLLRDKEK